jgi:hypothetical protein
MFMGNAILAADRAKEAQDRNRHGSVKRKLEGFRGVFSK